MTDKNTLTSVLNALRLLKQFSLQEPELGITDLSHKTGLGKSTVHRLVKTLCQEGFLTKNPQTNLYRLGFSLLEISGIMTAGLDLHNAAVDHVRKLVEKTNETAHIGVMEDDSVIYLYKHECQHPIRLYSHLGKRNPLYCTGSGKAILAFQPEEVIQNVLNGDLHPYTQHTVTDPEQLRLHLQQIRTSGYAISDQELHEGVISIAAPIHDYSGSVIASINIAGPIQRIKGDKIQTIVRFVMQTARKISEELGYYGGGKTTGNF